jgi:hypothetical protein
MLPPRPKSKPEIEGEEEDNNGKNIRTARPFKNLLQWKGKPVSFRWDYTVLFFFWVSELIFVVSSAYY